MQNVQLKEISQLEKISRMLNAWNAQIRFRNAKRWKK